MENLGEGHEAGQDTAQTQGSTGEQAQWGKGRRFWKQEGGGWRAQPAWTKWGASWVSLVGQSVHPHLMSLE